MDQTGWKLMTKEEAITIIAKHRAHSWKLWFKPWIIQDELLCLSDYFQKKECSLETSAPEVETLKKQLDEKDKAIKAVRAWILATFGPNALFGPPRDLLQDRFKLSPQK